MYSGHVLFVKFDIIHKGFPLDLLQIVHGDGYQGKLLVESDVNVIGFTGSQATGRDIMAKAAPSLKRLVMELGGNDPMIVMEDADQASVWPGEVLGYPPYK